MKYSDLVKRLRKAHAHWVNPLCDEAADEIERLEEQHDKFLQEFWKTNTENERLRGALALAWDALRWADSPGEGKDDEWSEIPTDRAQKAFDAVWMALGEKIHDLDALGADDE